MLHACEILFSGCVRASFLAQPNKALSRIKRARHCIRSHSAAPARPPQTMPRWPATVCRVPLPHTIRTRRRRAASPVWLEELTLPTATPPSRHVRSVRALAAAGSKDHEQRRPSRKRHVPTSEANTRLRIAIRQWCTPTAGTASRNWSPSRRRTSGHNYKSDRRASIPHRSPPLPLVIIRRPHPFKQSSS